MALSPELRAVLAVLILRAGQLVSVEKLIDAIWPDVDDQVARRRLHTVIWKLRTLLGSGDRRDGRHLLRWSSPGYVLEVADDQLDWTRFCRLRIASEEALREGSPALARIYLSAALSLWAGADVLSDVDVSIDDLGLVAERNAARERVERCLVKACFQLGEHERVIPELEARVAAEPLDDEAVAQLAVGYYRSANPNRALAACRRYLELWAEEDSSSASEVVTDLQTAILRRDPNIGSPTLRWTPNGPPGTESTLGRAAFLSAIWARFVPSPTGPLPAELLLVMAEHGGSICDATDSSIEVSFSEVATAFKAGIALQQALGHPPLARVGIDLPRLEGVDPAFEGPPRARARLLAAAARDGQILVSAGKSGEELEADLPPGAQLRPLGSHRLNALTKAVCVFQVTAPALAAVGNAPRWFDRGSVHNLADDEFRFVGREEEVIEITDRLVEARLVTLVGAPGSGKTRLAAHVAAGLVHEHRDGIWFVSLHSLSHPGLVAPAVADVLRLPRSAAAPLDVLLQSLRDRDALLVLDNCEHLLVECRDLVDRLLTACPGISVLATSREVLHSRFERVVSVPPLKPPPLGPPEAVSGNAAVQLFWDRLGSTPRSSSRRPHLSDDVEPVARICRAVEGVPLALVLAAARANELGTSVLADVLERTLGEGKGLTILSGTGDAHSPETLNGTIEWSYRLLEDRQRDLFDRLSVFRAGFGLEDAVAVCGGPNLSHEEVVIGLQRLVRASLVNVDDASESLGRFRLLQPVRDFASSKLMMRHRQAAGVRRRHAHHLLSVAQAAETHLRGPQDRATLDRLDASLPDLYAAVRWAIEEKEAAIALRLVGYLWVFWLVRGRIAEGRQMLESALALDPAPSAERVKALIACAQLAWFGGDLNRTRECNREVFAVSEATGDAWGWAWSALGFTALEMFGSEDDGVPIRIEEIIPLFRALGNDWDTGMALQTLGGAAWHRGQYERAERAQSETAGIFRSLGHPTLMSSLRVHGLMLALLGDLDTGAAEVDRSIVSSYEAGDLAGLAEALCCRGSIARYGGKHDLARHYYRDALRMACDAGQVWMIQWALDGLGSTDELGLRVAPERVVASVRLLARAEAMARETGIILAPRERQFHVHDLERARARLDDEVFNEAFDRGQRLTLDEAIDLALTLEKAAVPVGPD